MIIDANSKNSSSQPEINSSASTSSNGPSSDVSSNSGQSDGVGSTQSQGALDEGSTQKVNEWSTDPRKVPRSTGPRTPHGKTRSARNASKHKVLVGRILPEEANAAAYISEELTKDFNPHTVLEREIVLDLVVNRIQRRRIDKCNANEIVKAREHRFETFVDAEDQSQAEPWLRLTDTRRPDSVVRKRLTP